MGFFSFKTQDTDRSICNSESQYKPFVVYMTDNKGNLYREDNYEGYGVFGGKGYYELLAEMNGMQSDSDIGVSLAFENNKDGENPNIIYPNLSESPNWIWRNEIPKSCIYQGFFYENEPCDDGFGEYRRR